MEDNSSPVLKGEIISVMVLSQLLTSMFTARSPSVSPITFASLSFAYVSEWSVPNRFVCKFGCSCMNSNVDIMEDILPVNWGGGLSLSGNCKTSTGATDIGGGKYSFVVRLCVDGLGALMGA